MKEKFFEKLETNRVQELIEIDKQIEEEIKNLMKTKKEDILNYDHYISSLEIEDYLEKNKEEIIKEERKNNEQLDNLYIKREELFRNLSPEEQSLYLQYLINKNEIERKSN